MISLRRVLREGAATSNHGMAGAKTPPQSTAPDYRVVVEPARLVARLSFVAFVLLLIHSTLTVYHYRVHALAWVPWRQLFDVDQENNVPTWFSGCLLGVTALSVWIVADAKRELSDRWWAHWMLLAGGFLLLSLDEIAGLHETVNTIIDTTWAIPGGILALLTGVAFIPFLRSLPTATRNAFIVAGCIYVSGAVGLEIIGDFLNEDSMTYKLTTVVEEGMEMGGVIMCLAALLQYMGRSQGSSREVNVHVGVHH